MQMNIAEFYDKVGADKALQQKIMEGTDFQIDAIYGNAVRIGAEMGYEFTLDEARQFGSDLGSIPDEMLDMVSAGSPTSCNNGAAQRV